MSASSYIFFAPVEGPRFKKLFNIAWPITTGMLAANVLTLIDTIMLGRLGAESLAAVSIGGVMLTLLFATVMGLGVAVQAITSRRMGEGTSNQIAHAVHAGLALSLVAGIVFAGIGYLLGPMLVRAFSPDPKVAELALPYFRIMVVTLPGVGLNTSFRGFFNGIGKSGVYLTSLLTMIILNIFLNWVFIFGHLGAPALGTYGAGLASMLSYYAGNLVYLVQALKLGKPYGFGQSAPQLETILAVSKLAMPTMIHQALQGLNTSVYFGIMARVGTEELAATTIVWRLAIVLVLPAFGLGMAGATLVGHALGRKEKEDAKHWGWDTVKLGAMVMFVLGLPLVLLPRLVARAFVDDPLTAEMAVVPLVIVGATMTVNGCTWLIIQLLNGNGDNKYVMIMASGYNWLIGLPVVAVVALVLDGNLTFIWAVQVCNYFILCMMMVRRWASGTWAERQL